MSHKRKHCDLNTKYRAILMVEQHPTRSKTSIAQEFGVPQNTLSTWLKTKDKLKLAVESAEFGPKSKKMRKAAHPDVEDAVDLWLADARGQDVSISGPILREKAEILSKELGHNEFKCSTGWLTRYKGRKDIKFRSIKGEAKSAPMADVNLWKDTRLPQILQEYKPEDIYNADETGLFYRLQPDKSLVLKGEDCRGGKRSKERVTIMPCCNMTGTDKLQLLLIGKAKKPRCFQGVKSFPVQYRNNRCSWMTSVIFTEWIQAWDRKVMRQKRKICLIVDNCSAHPMLQT